MINLKETVGKQKKAVLVTVEKIGKETWNLDDREEELKRLAESCNIEIAGTIVSRRKALTANLFIGKGKVQEIADLVMKTGADIVIFNNDLSPSQQKNIEEIVNVKTIDRAQLILDIFAKRATSKEGKVQVELAQLVYLLPRLTGKGIELSRLGGGRGAKGLGEQKLEIDRRSIRERILRLKQELKEITCHREIGRVQREKFSMLSVALVGYTNSGKSTLFNALTSADVKTKDQLFSTLDPIVRKLKLSNNQTILISDTVGFIHDLPHHLIESFKATLEEVVNADILFHVIDMSDRRMEQENKAVFQVLEELGVLDKPLITVLNKSDKVPDLPEKERIKRLFPNAVVISALKKEGIQDLLDMVIRFIQKDMEDIKLVLPHRLYSVIKMIRENGSILREEYDENGVIIHARVPAKIKHSILKLLKQT